jgi:hypothetical protein
MSDAGSRAVVCSWNAGAASLGSVELTPCRRAKCTGVKSGTVGVDETDEKRNVGVGGAPCPARCFFCRALARFNRSSLQHQSLRPAKKRRNKHTKPTFQTPGRDQRPPLRHQRYPRIFEQRPRARPHPHHPTRPHCPIAHQLRVSHQ